MQRLTVRMILVAAVVTLGSAKTRGQGVDNAHHALEVGAASERLGNETRAISSYWRAIHLAEADRRAGDTIALASLWNLGTIYVKAEQWGRLDPVFDEYQKLRTAMPKMNREDGSWAVRFAMLFQSAHKYREAETLYLEGLDLLRGGTATSELASSLSNLASLYSAQGRHDEAISCVLKALDIADGIPVTLDRRALMKINAAAIYLESGKAAEASLNLEAAAAMMRDPGTTPETRMAFCWTNAKLLRKMQSQARGGLLPGNVEEYCSGYAKPGRPRVHRRE